MDILVDSHVITPVALWQGLSFKDPAIIGFGMSPRGEVAMIVGLIGLNQNLITQEIYAAIIFMSLITTMVTPHCFAELVV